MPSEGSFLARAHLFQKKGRKTRLRGRLGQLIAPEGDEMTSKTFKVCVPPAMFVEVKAAMKLAGFEVIAPQGGRSGQYSAFFRWLFQQRGAVDEWRREGIAQAARIYCRFRPTPNEWAAAIEKEKRTREAM